MMVPNMTQTGKRVVSNSIILSYWVIPLEVLPGISPDAFVTALHTSWEYLEGRSSEEGAEIATIEFLGFV